MVKNKLLSDISTVLKKASNRMPFVFMELQFIILIPLFFFFLQNVNAENNVKTLPGNCKVNQYDEIVSVIKVYDGDTIKLNDGRKIRFIGINTPERGRDGNKNEPFYLAAKDQLTKIIKENQNRLKIVFGTEKHDRYKRTLAHLFTMDGENISKILLQKGLGFNIAIPPNIKLLTCYQTAEKQARNLNRGIWSHPFSEAIDVSKLSKSSRGFFRITGTVKRIGESRSAFWLNLNTNQQAKFALRILKKDLIYFKEFKPKNLLHQHLIASGWVYQTKHERRMNIRHPASIQLLKTD